MILTRKEKENLVIKLANQGKSTKYIAQVVHISPKDIGTILRRYIGEEPTAEKSMSINSRAFKLIKENKNMVDVAISLNLDAHDVLDLHTDYLRPSNKNKLMSIYFELGDEIHLLAWLYDKLKMHGLANKKDIHDILLQEDKLKNLDKELYETAETIGKLNTLKMNLKKEIAEIMKIRDCCESETPWKY